MLRAIIALLLAVTAANAFAARPITVEQFEQFLAGTNARSDAELAVQIAAFTLTERMSSWQLSRLQATVPGEKARHAIIALADQSAFLPPPASEVSGAQAPSVVEQRRIISLVAAYFSKTIPQLPNFFATRVTQHFEDTPLLQKPGDFIPYEPVHFLNSTSVTVSYSNGREIERSPGGKTTKAPNVEQGLRTWGVFGPILGVVLLDAAQSKLVWARWEQEGSAPRAVFTYNVPREKSHYEVNYCCIAEEDATLSANVHPFHQIVGYHGDMTVDPASGTILRLTLEAELKTSDPVAKAAVMVEYGTVEIGGKPYICPIRSVSSTTAQMVQLDPRYKMPLARQLQPLKVRVSDVAFEQYHVFRSDARVLPEAVPEPGTTSTAPRSEQPATAPAPAPTEALSSPAPSSAATEPPAAVLATAGNSTSAQPDPPQAEITVVSSEGPAGAEPLPGAAESGFTLKTTTRLVDLAVVAFDKNGNPVTDLKREDFSVYDDGVAQKIRFLTQAEATPSTAAQTPSPDASQPQLYTNRQPVHDAGQLRRYEIDSTILMIDTGNLAWGDLTHAREETLRFLKTVPSSQPIGLYVLKSYSFQTLLEPTLDHTKVAETLSHWIPSAQDLSRAQAEEQRNRQQFDFVHSYTDLAHLNGNQSTAPDSYTGGLQVAEDLKHPTDAKLRRLGSAPGRDALTVIEQVGRHLAAIPGHKTLVWIASDNVLADWSNDSSTKEEKGSDFIHSIALRAQETLNEAHISIYPLDASQLEAGGISADLRERNIVPIGDTSRSPELATLGDSYPGFNPGRIKAQMQQDTHPIAGEYRELADATGGHALRRAGDIATELNGIVNDGRAAYQLSFSPGQPADDKYHAITVKVPGRKDIALRYRRGYLYTKDPLSLKDRFRQAIWQPRDVNEIGVTAVVQKDAAGAALKLNIAASDLAISEQGGLWMDKLDIFLVDRDDAAVHAQITGQTVGLRLRSSTYQNSLRDGIDFVQPVHLKPEDGSARVLIIDRNSGRIGSITVPAEALNPKQ